MLDLNNTIESNMHLAKEVSWGEKPRLHTMVEKLSVEAGLTKPKIVVTPGDKPEAYGMIDQIDTVIAVSEGMLKTAYPEQRIALVSREIERIQKLQ